MALLKIGDVFGIETSNGIAYFQYVHKNEVMGSLIRILPNLYQDTNKDLLNTLVKQKELYQIHFPLGAAFTRKIVSKMGNYPLPKDFVLPEKFRVDHIIKGEFICWHIVDYANWQRERVERLNDYQKRLSPWGTWNDTLLRKDWLRAGL
ncbi:hypothetical protein [Sporosarcina luteola]|uniref:hypothetical protein n=1 Tax=Sporosarcina luteola TaxID=582850 RepID=UPI00203D639C|nr:hypothetical protein [Sporosarcina luteola]MCM3711850.1 hypothetical protein [Sporosarcina luteola]